MVKRWIMHVDMDAFYAAVEQRDDQKLAGRPVIIGGLSKRGVVGTASYEARSFGIHSAMSMYEARRLCRDGVFLQPRISYYQGISQQIRQVMERYSPYIEPLSLDEAFLDISGMEGHFSSLTDMGRKIKKDIMKEVGLVASAGIGPNKFLAKLASDMEKPDGLVIIPYEQAAQIIFPLPATRLWGVGKVTAEALTRAGFSMIGQIASADLQRLRQVCGNQAVTLQQLAQGIDNRPVEFQREPKSIGNEETFLNDLQDVQEIDEKWRVFSNLVAWRLRKSALMGRTVAIKVRFSSFHTVTRSLTLAQGTDDEEKLYYTARQLYNKIRVIEPIRLLGLTVSNLSPTYFQMDLFDKDKSTKKEITKTLDALQERFGKQAIMKGFLWEIENKKRT